MNKTCVDTEKQGTAVLPVGSPPLDLPTKPSFQMPENACDAHVHMLAAPSEFPLWKGRVEDPAPGKTFDDWIAQYRAHLDQLQMTRAVIVHSIFYGTDNSVTVKAVRAMGAGFKGVGLLPDDATDADLDQFVDWAENHVVLGPVGALYGGFQGQYPLRWA